MRAIQPFFHFLKNYGWIKTLSFCPPNLENDISLFWPWTRIFVVFLYQIIRREKISETRHDLKYSTMLKKLIIFQSYIFIVYKEYFMHESYSPVSTN